MSLKIGLSLLSICAVIFLTLSPVHAEESEVQVIPDNDVLADGKLTPEEMARFLFVGKKQVEYLAEHAANEYRSRLKSDVMPMPSGWMLMKDGKTIKELKLDESGDGAPANIRLVMFRAALKSIARRGQINAATILYAGRLSESNPQKLLVFEQEHRLGISGSKYIPYEVDRGLVKFGESETKTKPFQLFYDSALEAPVQN